MRDEYGLELEHTGFEKREIPRLRMDIADTPKDEDAMPEEVKNVVSMPGDLWLLGDHRLICGSSTDRDTVNRLLAGAKPHLMVTDPPYGVKYNPEWRNTLNVCETSRTVSEREYALVDGKVNLGTEVLISDSSFEAANIDVDVDDLEETKTIYVRDTDYSVAYDNDGNAILTALTGGALILNFCANVHGIYMQEEAR